MSTQAKLFTIIAILSVTFLYADYERKKVVKLKESSGTYVLQNLPDFELSLLKDGPTNSLEVLKNSNALMVHFWGTWCAPCEVEFPDLLTFAKKLEERNIVFVLLAVKDEKKKVKKFLKRFKELPKNIVISVHEDTKLMTRFGTFKVPETFLFGKSGKLLRKYVGPQEWLNPVYLGQLSIL